MYAAFKTAGSRATKIAALGRSIFISRPVDLLPQKTSSSAVQLIGRMSVYGHRQAADRISLVEWGWDEREKCPGGIALHCPVSLIDTALSSGEGWESGKVASPNHAEEKA